MTFNREFFERNPEFGKGENNPMYGLKGELHPRYGKKHSEETKNKLKKPKTEEHKNKLSIAKKNAKKKTCYYCGKTMDPSNYGQYHGDKCKLKNKNYE